MNARTPLPVRRAEAADAAAITACVQAAYRLYIPRMGKAPGPMLDDYAEVVRHQRVFVAPAAPATSGNVEIAGVLVLKPGKDGILLDNVAVHPASQGHGLGARLIAFAEDEARRLGFTHLDLYTHECMVENIALYERRGYTETGRRTESGYNRIYMRKPLQPA